MKTLAAFSLALLVPAFAFGAGSKSARRDPPVKTENISPKDVTGNYAATAGAGADRFDVDVAQAGDALAVEFRGEFGISAHTCECRMSGAPTGLGKWTLAGGDGSKGTLRVFGTKLILELDSPPPCCGLGFPGAPDFSVAKATKPLACHVKADKAMFRDAAGAPTKSYAAKNDKVESFAVAEEQPDDDTLFVTRSAGKKKIAGFVRATDLDCPVATPSPAPAESP